MRRFFKKIFNTKTVSAFVLAMFLFSNVAVFALPANHAQAQSTSQILTNLGTCIASATVGGLLTSLLSSIGFTTGTSPGSGTGEVPVFSDDDDAKEQEENIKEELIDCLIWTATQALAEALGQNTIAWANTGNNGRPYYLRDEIGFNSGIEDEVSQYFINNDLAAANIPAYFKNNIVQDVTRDATRVSAQQILDCSSNQNVDTFFQQNFTSFTQFQTQYDGLVGDPACLPWSSYLLASAENDRRVQAALTASENELDRNDGYLNERDSTSGKTTTPGINTKDIVQRLIETNINQLEDAEEISEIVSTALNAVIGTIFSNSGSLCNSYVSGGCPP